MQLPSKTTTVTSIVESLTNAANRVRANTPNLPKYENVSLDDSTTPILRAKMSYDKTKKNSIKESDRNKASPGEKDDEGEDFDGDDDTKTLVKIERRKLQLMKQDVTAKQKIANQLEIIANHMVSRGQPNTMTPTSIGAYQQYQSWSNPVAMDLGIPSYLHIQMEIHLAIFTTQTQRNMVPHICI